MNSNDRRVVKTKRAIREAFTKLIQQKPVKTITISEIAREADIDRRTFYLHYSCTDDIILAIEKEDGNKLSQVFKDANGFDLDKFFKHFTNLLMENYDYYSCIIKNPEYSRFELRCKDILKDEIHRTFFAKSGLSKTEFDIYSEYVSSGIMGVYTNWVRNNSGKNIKEQTELDELTKLARIAVADGWNKIT